MERAHGCLWKEGSAPLVALGQAWGAWLQGTAGTMGEAHGEAHRFHWGAVSGQNTMTFPVAHKLCKTVKLSHLPPSRSRLTSGCRGLVPDHSHSNVTTKRVR